MKYIMLLIWGSALLLYIKSTLEFVTNNTRGGRNLKKDNKLFVLFGIAAELAIPVWVIYRTLAGHNSYSLYLLLALIIIENIVYAQFE